MATCPSTIASYTEEIETFVFRGDDDIKIPKSFREGAYELAVDIIIRSIPRESYKNYDVNPPESFYGNVVLVMQDACELKIPIKFPRQRLYYGRVEEAFVNWQALINFEYQRAYFLAVGESITSLGSALGAGVIPGIFCCSMPDPTWRELPLREVFVNVPFGVQYELEISRLTPVSFEDSCGQDRFGKSGQTDGAKDVGLPENGSFPNIAADSDDPYAGLPPASSTIEQGGFANNKTAFVDQQDEQSLAERTFRFTFYPLRCPFPQDPTNPSTSCSRFNDGTPEVAELTGRVFGTVTGSPNPACPACPTLAVTIDGVVTAYDPIFELVSVEVL